MYRMYGRNVFSCRNVNLYEKGYGSQIQRKWIEFPSGYAWFTWHFFPTTTTLFLIWVWLFEICKRGTGGGQFYVQNESQSASYPVGLSVCEGSQQQAQSPLACWSGKCPQRQRSAGWWRLRDVTSSPRRCSRADRASCPKVRTAKARGWVQLPTVLRPSQPVLAHWSPASPRRTGQPERQENVVEQRNA